MFALVHSFNGPELRRLRVEKASRKLDISVGRGLEIMPLSAPFMHRAAADARYVDVHPVELLRSEHGSHPQFDVNSSVEIDHWLIDDNGDVGSLAEAAAISQPFDGGLASHVTRHIPGLLGWLADVA